MIYKNINKCLKEKKIKKYEQMQKIFLKILKNKN